MLMKYNCGFMLHMVSCQHRDEPSGSIKCGEFLDQLKNC